MMPQRDRAGLHQPNTQGMTLIEVMIVIAITSLLMGAVSFQLWKKWKEAQIETTKQEILTTMGAMTSYRIDHPDPCPRSLVELAAEEELERDPLDAWGEPLLLRCPAERGKGLADIWSKGPDGEDGTKDDIGSWSIRRKRRGKKRQQGEP